MTNSNKDTDFSVIIPYKNASIYMEKCLDSLNKQIFKDFEVICVNDNSDDNSLDIVNSFLKLDERFKNINSEKDIGCGGARNLGIENAAGKYLVFVDADDWVDTNLLSKLNDAYKEHPEADSIWYNYSDFVNDKDYYAKNYVNEGFLKITPENILNYPEYAWQKSFKTEFIKNNNIKFTENLFFEANAFYFHISCCNPKIYCIPDILYYYRRNPYSITGNRENLTKRNNHFFKTAIEAYEIVLKNKYDSAYKDTILEFVSKYISQYKVRRNPFTKAEYSSFLEAIKQLDEQYN